MKWTAAQRVPYYIVDQEERQQLEVEDTEEAELPRDGAAAVSVTPRTGARRDLEGFSAKLRLVERTGRPLQQSTGPSLAFMTAAHGPALVSLSRLSGPREPPYLLLLQAWGAGNAGIGMASSQGTPPRGRARAAP